MSKITCFWSKSKVVEHKMEKKSFQKQIILQQI